MGAPGSPASIAPAAVRAAGSAASFNPAEALFSVPAHKGDRPSRAFGETVINLQDCGAFA
jgi:hypothetical protein